MYLTYFFLAFSFLFIIAVVNACKPRNDSQYTTTTLAIKSTTITMPIINRSENLVNVTLLNESISKFSHFSNFFDLIIFKQKIIQ